MGSRFTLAVPADYVLKRDGCSYGYFVLDPNFWDVANLTYTRILELDSGPARLVIAQAGASASKRHPERGAALSVKADRALSRAERMQAAALITRMLRLDEPAGTIAEFHKLDRRYKRSGRGRLMRSPTFFEDVIKTVTSCNVTWPSTVTMSRRLCEVVGAGGAFPTAKRLARTRVTTLRSRCRVGYRDQRIIDLARLFASGEVDPEWFEDPGTADDAIWKALIELPGIGPYAAANIMQLLGRYHRLPLDTESIRHAKTILGMEGTDAAIMRRMRDHYAPMGVHAFRSYWFELWDFYEKLKGPSWTWQRETTGTSFTAAQMR